MATEQREKALSEGAKRPSVETFPWERQPGEGPAAFARFLAYRDMPATERSQAKVADVCEISTQLVGRWSKRYCWVKRAIAYDNWMLQLGDKLGKHAVLRSRAALARLSSVCLDKAEASAMKLDETKLDANEIGTLGKLAVTTMEAAFGPTGNRAPSGPQVVVQTQVGYGEARPSWLERSETKPTKPERIVGQIEEKVLEASEGGVPRTVQGKLTQPRGKLKQLVMSAPVRTEDP